MSRKIDNGFFQNCSMKMLDDINVLLYASSFECSWGLIKCSSSFGDTWNLVNSDFLLLLRYNTQNIGSCTTQDKLEYWKILQFALEVLLPQPVE